MLLDGVGGLVCSVVGGRGANCRNKVRINAAGKQLGK